MVRRRHRIESQAAIARAKLKFEAKKADKDKRKSDELQRKGRLDA